MFPRWAKITIAVLSVFMVSIVLIGIYGDSAPRASSSGSGSSKPSASSFSPITFTGSGDKNTAPFTIPTKEWIIDWECEIDDSHYDFILAITIYSRGENLPLNIIVASPEISGSTYIYTNPGDYYLGIMAYNTRRWEITVRPA